MMMPESCHVMLHVQSLQYLRLCRVQPETISTDNLARKAPPCILGHFTWSCFFPNISTPTIIADSQASHEASRAATTRLRSTSFVKPTQSIF